MSTQAKNLTTEAATSPGKRFGNYVILGRLADKARAEFLGGNVGEYHTDCPLDHMRLDWKGVQYGDIKKEIVDGADNDALATFLDTHGTSKKPDEVKAWSDSMDKINPYENPEKRDWFAGECAKLGLDPAETTMFQWLDADDKATFSK